MYVTFEQRIYEANSRSNRAVVIRFTEWILKIFYFKVIYPWRAVTPLIYCRGSNFILISKYFQSFIEWGYWNLRNGEGGKSFHKIILFGNAFYQKWSKILFLSFCFLLWGSVYIKHMHFSQEIVNSKQTHSPFLESNSYNLTEIRSFLTNYLHIHHYSFWILFQIPLD